MGDGDNDLVKDKDSVGKYSSSVPWTKPYKVPSAVDLALMMVSPWACQSDRKATTTSMTDALPIPSHQIFTLYQRPIAQLLLCLPHSYIPSLQIAELVNLCALCRVQTSCAPRTRNDVGE